MIVSSNQPLIGIPVADNQVEYFTNEAEAEAASTSQTTNVAISLLGAWSDLDWDAALEELDRIRHESKPTPPIDEV